jgi:hypothetical protein
VLIDKFTDMAAPVICDMMAIEHRQYGTIDRVGHWNISMNIIL